MGPARRTIAWGRPPLAPVVAPANAVIATTRNFLPSTEPNTTMETLVVFCTVAFIATYALIVARLLPKE